MVLKLYIAISLVSSLSCHSTYMYICETDNRALICCLMTSGRSQASKQFWYRLVWRHDLHMYVIIWTPCVHSFLELEDENEVCANVCECDIWEVDIHVL